MFKNPFITAALVALLLNQSAVAAESELKDHENRFEISLFAEHPQIVNPIGVQVDERGRVFVIESHTHFRPKDYDGPQADRILLLEDTNGDHKADKTTVFHEGLVHAMDLALNTDGSLYVATRSAIHRMRDKNDDGKADEDVKLIDLQTNGNYPHNGLSGVAFDGKGGLYFGFGENLGEAYKLVGSDKTTLSGEGEGGNVYHCQLDGTKLRQVATGFWNPFGVCVDPAGNVFATDNDPDSSPPCRLLHIIEGGDYGYQFRYGRSGLHVFQAWNGELPGTLPMVTGTGEAPCEIVPYDGGLLVASWADNRLEQYTLVPRGASFGADRKILISGDLNFRPVGIGVAKDGTLYVSDWASASYELPSKGRIWKLKPRKPVTQDAPAAATQSTTSRSQLTVEDLAADDPFIRGRAIALMGNGRKARASLDPSRQTTDIEVASMFIAARRNGANTRFIRARLTSPNSQVRFLALKWIADERVAEYRDEVEKGLQSANLTRELFAAHLAALERIDGKKIGDFPDPALVLPILKNAGASPGLRAFALQMLPANHRELSIEFISSLLAQKDEQLQMEAVRTMNAAPSPARRRLLADIASDQKRAPSIRREAASGLAGAVEYKDQLLALALGGDELRDAALRSLVEVPLSENDKQRLEKLNGIPEAKRLFGEQQKTPPLDDVRAWLDRTEGEGDPQAGREIFFHAKVGYCSRCHRYDGRGNHVGPDLTKIRERGREWLLTSILQPARDVAPAYRQWQIEFNDGRTMTGISLRKGSHSEDYLGADGKTFSVKLTDMEARREIETSMMPEGLAQTMTAKELRDVLAFLLANDDGQNPNDQ
jgi:putative membrane-bound dehydrogenase-like protein